MIYFKKKAEDLMDILDQKTLSDFQGLELRAQADIEKALKEVWNEAIEESANQFVNVEIGRKIRELKKK